MYEGESLNRSQMGIKHKEYDIRTWKNSFITRHIMHQHWYTFPIPLPVCRNPQQRSFLTVVLATSALPFQPHKTSANLCHVSRPSSGPLYATNTSHRKQETFVYEHPLHWALLPTNNAQQNAGVRWYTPQALSSFWLLNLASEHELSSTWRNYNL
jgi:hypothetical protein